MPPQLTIIMCSLDALRLSKCSSCHARPLCVVFTRITFFYAPRTKPYCLIAFHVAIWVGGCGRRESGSHTSRGSRPPTLEPKWLRTAGQYGKVFFISFHLFSSKHDKHIGYIRNTPGCLKQPNCPHRYNCIPLLCSRRQVISPLRVCRGSRT